MTHYDSTGKWIIDWDDAGRMVNELLSKVKDFLKFKNVKIDRLIAIERGSLPLIPSFSSGLNPDPTDKKGKYDINEISYYKPASKTGYGIKEAGTLWPLPTAGEKVLVVDEVSDKGNALSELSDILKSLNVEAYYATLHIKPRTQFVPDVYLKSVDNETWIDYPWEMPKQAMEEKEKVGI